VRFEAQRDRREDHSASRRYVSDEAVGYEDLDEYGGWRNTPDYGTVWFPHTTVAGWAPYRYGHWVWIAPWGYTWVDDEPWGFAPFHYGRWVAVGGDWGWIERKTLAAPLEKVAFSLPVGKISHIVDFGGNYYILRVDDKRGGSTRSLAEVRPEIEKKLMQQKAQHLQEQWIASLRSKAYIRTF